MTDELTSFFNLSFERLLLVEEAPSTFAAMVADYCACEFERRVMFDERLVRWRVAYQPALTEAVREQRPMTWVAGIPGVWGAHNVPVRHLWEVT